MCVRRGGLATPDAQAARSTMRTALVRPPSLALAEGERTFVQRAPLDAARALEQHQAYVALLVELGVVVRELAPLPEHPDGTFVEDTAVVLDELAVIARPGALSRRAETESVAAALARHRELVRVEAPCTLDGGDVLAMGQTILVGQSTRTNHAALKFLAHALLEHGYRVKAVEVSGALHLKTALSYLGPDTLLVQPAWIHAARIPPANVIEVDPREPFAANVLALGAAVVVPSAHPRTAERLAAHGFDVRTLDLSEFHKAEAGPTCLSLLFEDDRGSSSA